MLKGDDMTWNLFERHHLTQVSVIIISIYAWWIMINNPNLLCIYRDVISLSALRKIGVEIYVKSNLHLLFLYHRKRMGKLFNIGGYINRIMQSSKLKSIYIASISPQRKIRHERTEATDNNKSNYNAGWQMPSGHLVKGTKVTVANTPPRIYYQKTVDVEQRSKENY